MLAWLFGDILPRGNQVINKSLHALYLPRSWLAGQPSGDGLEACLLAGLAGAQAWGCWLPLWGRGGEEQRRVESGRSFPCGASVGKAVGAGSSVGLLFNGQSSPCGHRLS